MSLYSHFYVTTNGVLGTLYRIYPYNNYPEQQPLCNGFYDMGQEKLAGEKLQKARIKRYENVGADSHFWLSYPGLDMHTDIFYWDFFIWLDPCGKYPLVYVDYHPPIEFAPPGYGYEYVVITDPGTGETKSIPSEDLTNTQILALTDQGGTKVTAEQLTKKVTLPGSSWLSNLNLSDYKTWIGVALLGFVGYEIFRSLKK